MRASGFMVAGVLASAVLFTVDGCGSSSKAPTVVGGVSASSVEHALLANGGPPRPTTASCRAASAAERAVSPFEPTRLPLFTCELTVSDARATYVVQVLHNGCFVAERTPPGRAVYGCGVARI
jgi:hypothetical protein